MIPKGFLLSTAEAAIKAPGRSDMALLYSETEAAVAGVFTTNRIKAAPVRLDMERIKSGRGRGIIVNSGNANACTGQRGMRDAEETARLAARRLGVDESLLFVCSTGVIGVPMPMSRVRAGIKRLAEELGQAELGDVARAVMTTDTFPKFVSRKFAVGSREGVIAAVCKGAGMIEPDMATMLCFVMTDVAVEGRALKRAIKEAVEGSFNRITVDGDRSTNDTVLVMANGALGNNPVTAASTHFGKFSRALADVLQHLARAIVKDGEGATKLVEIEVTGARSEAEAKKAAFAVANSPLVKTAVYGNDPNWGRIMAVLGACGVALKEEETDISLAGVKVVSGGVSTRREKQAAKAVARDEFKISIGLNVGGASARVLTCDLTEEYIRINAEYTT